MPPKRVIHKTYNSTRATGESRNPPAIEQPKRVREFTPTEWHRLASRFSTHEIYWLVHNNDTKVGDFIDHILAFADTKPPSPKKPFLENHFDDLLRTDHQPAPKDEPEDETASVRHCITCDNFSHKDDMVKCRRCGYWYHPWCADEPDQDGRSDPYFSFWLCPHCKSVPTLDPGYNSTYRSEADIEKRQAL